MQNKVAIFVFMQGFTGTCSGSSQRKNVNKMQNMSSNDKLFYYLFNKPSKPLNKNI